MPAPAHRGDRTPTPPNANLSFAALKDPRLSARDQVIFWSLAYWAWGLKPECFPSNAQIGEVTGYSARSVAYALKQLAHCGYIYRKLVITKTGCYRIITIVERYQPTLTMVEGKGGGCATACTTPDATACTTPTQGVAQPVMQGVAPKEFEDSEPTKKELPPPSSPKEGGTSAGGRKEEGEPAWMKVDNLTPAEVDEWRNRAQGGPMARIARQICERWDRLKSTSASGSLPRSPEADVEGNASQRGNSIKNPVSGQDK